MPTPDTLTAAVGISAVERDTGLSKDTLRMWERRYGFPQPLRDRNGERAYPREQVHKLRLIRKLLACGHRPGKIIAASVAELEALAAQQAAAPAAEVESRLAEVLELIRSHDLESLRQDLAQALARQGLARFVTDTVAPLNRLVGDAWMRGDLAIYEEHLYTEQVQGLLRAAIGALASRGGRPRVLLTSLPNESHGLGLLMAEAMLALEGAACFSLGVQTPAPDIVRAAQAHRADVIALSFSASFPAALAAAGLQELRAGIAETTELWAGGSGVRQMRRGIAGVRLIPDLEEIAPAVAAWRGEHDAG